MFSLKSIHKLSFTIKALQKMSMYINDEQKKISLCEKEKLNKLGNNRFSCLAFYVKSVL